MDNLEPSIATQLLTDVLRKVSSSSPNTFLTATDVYRLGLVIYNLNHHHQQQDYQSQEIIFNVQKAAHAAILQGLPINIRQGLFDDLYEALQQVIITPHDTTTHEQQEKEEENFTRALQSFVGIWSLLLARQEDDGAKKQHQSRRRARLALRWPKELEISLCLIALYPKLSHLQNKTCQSLILEFLSLVWLTPIMHKDDNNVSSSSSQHLEDFLTILHSLQEQEIMWQDLILYHEQQQQQQHVGGGNSSSSWRQDLVKSLTLNDAMQRDYLSSLLMYEKTTPETRTTTLPLSSTVTITTPTRKGVVVQKIKDPMQERIDQVRAIIPNVGEGFIEVALSLYHGNVEQTISALLLEPNEQLPPGLQYIDRQLPRRKNPNAMITLNDDDDKEAQVARQVTKKALQAEEERQRLEAIARIYVSKTGEPEDNNNNNVVDHHHDEYDDEYDDQWDDLGGTTAGADDGLYDRLDNNDYHAVLAYNRAMKQVVGEQSFWDEQRNTNRNTSSAAAAGAAAAATPYRGPDKIKGGRIPGRGGGRGGGGGRGNQDNDDTIPAAGGKGKNQGNAAGSSTPSTGSNDNKPSKSSQRHKANKLASRREQQKQSMNKRSGGM